MTVVDAVDANGNDYPDVTWRGNGGDSDNTWVAQNCQAGSTCWIASGSGLRAFGSTASNHAQALLAVDSGQRVLEVYHDQMDNGVNERDYDANFNVSDETFLHHNCLTAQDAN